MLCGGDASEFCGGPMLLSLYSIYPQAGASSLAVASSVAAIPSTVPSAAHTSVLNAVFASSLDPAATSLLYAISITSEDPATKTISSGLAAIASLTGPAAFVSDPAAQSSGASLSDSLTTTSHGLTIISTSAALALSSALSAFSSLVLPGVVSPTTSAASSSLPSQISDPFAVGNWALVGCYGSNDGFSTFTPADLAGAANCVGACAAACANQSSKYVGLYEG